jgi:trigger factor
MKATVESQDSIFQTIRVEVPWKTVAEELDRAYRELGRDVAIKGFRKGKVPRNVLRQRFGRRVEEEVLSRVIADSFEAAVIQHRVRVVSKPELERGELKEGKPYKYTARVEISPDIELKEIRFDVEVEKPKVTGKMIQEHIDHLREHRAVLVPIEGRDTAQNGDIAIINYRVEQDGKPLGDETKNHELELGSGKALPGFESQVAGMRLLESKEFDLTFPEDWKSKNLAGKPARFFVTLNALREREIPAVNDEFVKDLGREGCGTVEELEKSVREELLERERLRVRREAKEKLVDKLIEKNPFPVPPSLVDRQQEALAREMESYLSYQGVAVEEVGLDRKKMKKEMKDRAERDVRSTLLLDAVADQEKISVGESDIEKKLGEVAQQMGQNLAKIKSLYEDEQARARLRHQLLQDKVLDYLLQPTTMNVKKEGSEPPAQKKGKGKGTAGDKK